jgi:hypothetical protein
VGPFTASTTHGHKEWLIYRVVHRDGMDVGVFVLELLYKKYIVL